jgi:hypothetical protein
MILNVYNSLIELVNKEFKDICEDAAIMFSNVVSSKIPDDPISALKYFLQRVKEKILQFKVQT